MNVWIFNNIRRAVYASNIIYIGLLFFGDGLYFCVNPYQWAWVRLTVAIGIMFILWSTFYDAFKTKGFLKFIKGLFTFGMIVLVIYSGIICVVGKSDNATYREDYIIVLGAGLKGDTPSLALERRLEQAAEYMNKNGNAIAIVSGGQGKGETISEAQAMENYLLNHGIREDRIIKEDNSTSTYENFEYSKLIMDEGQAVFVTNEFHVLRSELMAKINGIDATHIGASTPIPLLPVSCVREFIAQIAAVRYYF